MNDPWASEEVDELFKYLGLENEKFDYRGGNPFIMIIILFIYLSFNFYLFAISIYFLSNPFLSNLL